jgi:hypothetical protein
LISVFIDLFHFWQLSSVLLNSAAFKTGIPRAIKIRVVAHKTLFSASHQIIKHPRFEEKKMLQIGLQ